MVDPTKSFTAKIECEGPNSALGVGSECAQRLDPQTMRFGWEWMILEVGSWDSETWRITVSQFAANATARDTMSFCQWQPHAISPFIRATSPTRLRTRDRCTWSTLVGGKKWSRSKFASHYAWGTNRVSGCKMDGYGNEWGELQATVTDKLHKIWYLVFD